MILKFLFPNFLCPPICHSPNLFLLTISIDLIHSPPQIKFKKEESRFYNHFKELCHYLLSEFKGSLSIIKSHAIMNN